jgi:hypothetical protein
MQKGSNLAFGGVVQAAQRSDRLAETEPGGGHFAGDCVAWCPGALRQPSIRVKYDL